MHRKVRVTGFTVLCFFIAGIAPAVSGSMFDQDNPLAIDLNTTISGGYNDDHPMYNYFAVTLEQDGDFRITHAASSGYVYFQVTAADPEQNGGMNIIPYQYGDGEDDNARLYALQAGTYKVRVENHLVDITSYTLTNSFLAASLTNDPEPNGDMDTAALLPLDEISGHLGYAYDAYGAMPVINRTDSKDMWKITTLKDGYLETNVTMESTLEFSLYLYDDDMEIVSVYYDSDNYDNVEFQVAAGTYYVSTNDVSGFGSYTLTTTFQAASLVNDAEPNDERQDARILPMNESITGHLGFCSDGGIGYNKSFDTYDWWTITTTEDGLLTITTQAADEFGVGPISDIYLYTQDAAILATNYNSENAPVVEASLPLAAGTYTVRVRLRSGYGSYTISSDVAGCALANDSPDNDSRENAVTMSLGTPVTGHLGYQDGLSADTYDYWELMVQESDIVSVTLDSEGDTEDPLIMNLYVYDDAGGYVTIDYNSDDLPVVDTVIENQQGPIYIRTGRKSGYGSYTLSAEVQTPDPLIITTASLDEAIAGNEYSQTITVENVLDETLSFAMLEGPAWLSIDNAGVLSGTPADTDAESGIPVSIEAFTESRADTLTITIDVLPPLAVHESVLPEAFSIDHPRPNPFNASTTIRYRVPVECMVHLTVYDILGRKIADLVESRISPGMHEVVWNGRDNDGAALGSGMYLFRFIAGDYSHTAKVMLLQ